MAAFLRFLAGIMLMTAVVLAVNDATAALSSQPKPFVTIQQAWSAVSPASLKSSQGAVSRYTHPAIWDWGVLKVLQLPAWVLFAIAGLMLAYLGRRRRRVNVYAN